jgi:hypothetical protein
MTRFKIRLTLGLISLFMLVGAVANATPFDPEEEVTTFLETMLATGWPIFIALAGGLVAVILASGAVRNILRRVSKLFTRA